MRPDEIEAARRLVLAAVIIGAAFYSIPVLKMAWQLWIIGQ